MRRSSAALTALGVLLPAAASATIMVPVTIEEMAQESACVVRAKVTGQTAAWDEKKERIYTTTTLEVLDAIHASVELPRTVGVRTLGGEVGDIGMKVAGTPAFTLGEEVVVFLRVDPLMKSAFQVIAMSQGKFHVEREAKGRAVVVPSLEGLVFAKAGADGALRADPSAAPAVGKMPLEDLRRRVVEAVKLGKANATPAPAAPASPVLDAPLAPKTPATPR